MDGPEAFDFIRIAFERTGIRYAVGGSWASTAFGEPRFTNDVDIIAELTPENVIAFLGELPETFYVDEEAAINALRNGRPFNTIYMPTVLKFDLFPAASFPLGAKELDRAVALANTGLSAGVALFVTPEDILLAKLHWFQLGNGMSAVQWRDIQGLIRGCRASLDFEYLRANANRLQVLNLLDQALGE